MSSTEFDNISFDMPKSQSNTIKVIGVGGGGSNAVNHMFQQNTKGVDYVICNTDAQALESSPIPNKIQLGVSLTSGLGAGANPAIGEEAAIESLEEIRSILTIQTKMVFITAGMGGGTGTGAAPIIAKLAKDMGLLTVGVVTMPFQFEGRMRTLQAQKGVDELRKNVDSLIVINNNKLREVYGNLGFKAGFSKADEVLSTASRGIAEVITHHYKQNIDLHDAKTVLSNSGTAIMGAAKESGTNRAKNAIVKALDSPLLNDNKITGAKNVLLLIISGKVEVTLDEIGEINEFIQTEAGYEANIIMGVGEDESLEDEISLTVVATGFAADQQCEISDIEEKKVIHTLEDEQKAIYSFEDKNSLKNQILSRQQEASGEESKIVHELEEEEESLSIIVDTTKFIENLEVQFEEVKLDKNLHGLSEFSEGEFEIKDIAVEKAPEVSEEAPVQMDLLFDMPIVNIEEVKIEKEAPVYFSLDDSVEDFINGIDVVAYEEVKPKIVEEPIAEEPTIKNCILEEKIDINKIEDKGCIEVRNEEPKITRYSLEDFDIQPTIKNASTIDVNNFKVIGHEEVKVDKVVVDEELLITIKKTKDTPTVDIEAVGIKKISPLDATISEIQQRCNSRREKMKKFNYKFMNNVSQNVDDIEKQPAYKRMGVDLEEVNSLDLSKSRTTLSIDDNDEILLRSNNSFLHDNVD
ncbi:cell division protein FtsZ [Flavicella sp.]|uniref:cell division protein FtsZ n=1 Tax=Flavicella sp. TaxID=2957742 RepID=UPI00301A4259